MVSLTFFQVNSTQIFFQELFFLRLPYKEHKRRIVFQGAPTVHAHDKVKNLVIQWQSPQANIKKSKKDSNCIEFKFVILSF